jgi:uncharacterized protein YqeY
MVDDLKAMFLQARKDRDETKKKVLSLVIGECQSIEMRQGSFKPEQCVKIIKKLIHSNEETLNKAGSDWAGINDLEEENKFLYSLLPQTMSVEEIVQFLENVEGIKEANADGPAIGIAIKALKGSNCSVDNKDVAVAVSNLRK